MTLKERSSRFRPRLREAGSDVTGWIEDGPEWRTQKGDALLRTVIVHRLGVYRGGRH